MTTEFDMSGKVAMVTGASSGFGVHFAKIMAARGAKVVVAARRVERLEALVAEIKADGGEAMAVAMDVTDSASIITAFDQAEAAFGTVTMLANNAGVADVRSALKIGEDDWDKMIDTNLKGVWIAGQQAAKRMIEAGVSGSIVNTASILGLRVAFGQSSYSASKAAVIQLTKSMALEWAGKGVRVNALCPGLIRTDFAKALWDNPEAAQRVTEQTPLRRFGEADDFKGMAVFVASDASAYVTGQALTVCGGTHMFR